VINLRIYGFLVLCVGLALSSCDKALKVDVKSKEKLVLNAILKVDEPITVELSKTRNLFDENDKIDWVRSADVYLTCADNSFPELLTYLSNGVYQSTHTAQHGEEYSIEVIHSTFDNISATAVMPEETQGDAKYTGDNEGFQNFEINIKNENSKNFYIWEMLERTEGGASNIEIFSGDSRTDNILPEETQVQKLIFFEGLNASDVENINSSFSTNGISDDQIENSEIRLITVNQDMYKYYRSLELYKNARNNFVKPIEIYSNVNNGLGIFGAISESVFEITQ